VNLLKSAIVVTLQKPAVLRKLTASALGQGSFFIFSIAPIVAVKPAR